MNLHNKGKTDCQYMIKKWRPIYFLKWLIDRNNNDWQLTSYSYINTYTYIYIYIYIIYIYTSKNIYFYTSSFKSKHSEEVYQIKN